MFSLGLLGGPQSFDPLVLLVIALGLEAGLATLPGFTRLAAVPSRLARRLVSALDAKLNRERRSEMDRALRGAIVALGLAAAAAVLGWGIAWLGQNHHFGWIVELALMVALIDQGRRYAGVRAVATAFSAGHLEAARLALDGLVTLDPGRMDEHGVARAAVESAAEGFCTGAVAPAFWYALFGFPGLAVSSAAAVMNEVLGHRTPRYRAFGMAAARLNDILMLIPACLAGLCVVFAAVVAPTARPGRAFATMVRDAGRHRSRHLGWPVAAMAGGLDVALAGPRQYAGLAIPDPWIGGGTARLAGRDIRRALYLYAVACLVNAGWVAALVLVRLGLAS
ncbi:cobalamin biosynthesis protein CobD/CbiB [Shumkonia mesophila]|uniref:cobalamin biosynthesis protein CobD/CbiB n=1 Tax=Shumkonia mesophila TaxID=2838854 RepID=UPI0029342D39|nr:CobD/CbiB family cobalamin biosynthesis protein [Shumkonia mesophila]